MRARSSGRIARHPGKARRAAATAASMSDGWAAATSAMTSLVAGSMVAIVEPPAASFHAPSINSFVWKLLGSGRPSNRGPTDTGKVSSPSVAVATTCAFGGGPMSGSDAGSCRGSTGAAGRSVVTYVEPSTSRTLSSRASSTAASVSTVPSRNMSSRSPLAASNLTSSLVMKRLMRSPPLSHQLINDGARLGEGEQLVRIPRGELLVVAHRPRISSV